MVIAMLWKVGLSQLEKDIKKYERIMVPAFESGMVEEIYRGPDFSVCKIPFACCMIAFFSGTYHYQEFIAFYVTPEYAKKFLTNNKYMRITAIETEFFKDNHRYWNVYMFSYFQELRNKLISEGKDPNKDKFENSECSFAELEQFINQNKKQIDEDNQYILGLYKAYDIKDVHLRKKEKKRILREIYSSVPENKDHFQLNFKSVLLFVLLILGGFFQILIFFIYS